MHALVLFLNSYRIHQTRKGLVARRLLVLLCCLVFIGNHLIGLLYKILDRLLENLL